MIVIIARLAYTIQAPMTASPVDAAKVNMDLAGLEDQFRIILGFATLGSLLGMLRAGTCSCEFGSEAFQSVCCLPIC